MERYPFALRLATPGDLSEVRELVQGAAEWLRTTIDTDQWANPWPDAAGHEERILNDLVKGKTWLLWDDMTVAGTITVDTDEPVALDERPVWPSHKSREPALYVRRVIIRRSYAGLRLGAALLDWAAALAYRDHGVRVIRVDVWTTNRKLHAYYEDQRFTRCEGRDPRELANYPSQALFERHVGRPRSDYARLLMEEDPGERYSNGRALHDLGR